MSKTKALQKPKTNVQKSPRKQQSLNIPKANTIKEQKKRRQTAYMPVGSKTFKISRKIIKEIKRYQTSVHNLIPKLPFSRLVQEIILAYVPEGRRIQRAALEALQEASEYYLVQYLEDSYICTLHARRVTLIPRDMELVELLRGDS